MTFLQARPQAFRPPRFVCRQASGAHVFRNSDDFTFFSNGITF